MKQKNTLPALFFILLCIAALFLVGCGPSLDERRAAAPLPQWDQVISVKEGFQMGEEDDEHYVTLQNLGTLEVVDSQLWQVDDDQTIAALQSAQAQGGRVCVRTEEQGWGNPRTVVVEVMGSGRCN